MHAGAGNADFALDPHTRRRLNRGRRELERLTLISQAGALRGTSGARLFSRIQARLQTAPVFQ